MPLTVGTSETRVARSPSMSPRQGMASVHLPFTGRSTIVAGARASGALPERLDLATLDELLQGDRAAGLPVAVAVLEGHHGLARARAAGGGVLVVLGAPAARGHRA